MRKITKNQDRAIKALVFKNKPILDRRTLNGLSVRGFVISSSSFTEKALRYLNKQGVDVIHALAVYYSSRYETTPKITGACNAGMREFCESHGLSTRKKYRLGDILPKLKGEFGYKYIIEALSK